MKNESALDNPVWSSLTTRHAHLAQGGRHALRYPPAFSPLGGISVIGEATIEALNTLVDVGDDIAVAGPRVPEMPSNWETLDHIRITQMIRRDSASLPEGVIEASTLSAVDVGEMLALVDLTHPGPFRERTIELGSFIGIREHGRLMAMAGERMWIGDHREVSGVCTHPEAQGRGFAKGLMGLIINRMLRAGQVPFLHVDSNNGRAIAVYEGLGFVRRVTFPLVHAKRLA